MTELNSNPEQLPGPDFEKEIKTAQSSGDYEFVMDTAKKSHKMLLDFRDVVKRAQYSGADSGAVAMGLNFLENMVSQSAGQLEALKRAEKDSRAAAKVKPVLAEATNG